nr:retrovirus-related Pol polyprotein from transposon TNT 1-94 [Tanacetum cinerariifolium]
MMEFRIRLGMVILWQGVGHFARDCTVRPRRRDAAYLQTQLLIAQKEEAGIQLQAEEYDLMAAAADLDEIEEVNANCILMANLQQASSSGTQNNCTPVYDSDGSAEVHENYDNNEIFNMFTQEEQYTELLEPIPEPQQVPQNDNNVISEVTNVEQDGEIVEQHSVNLEETCALYESLYQNLAIKVKKVNSVNRKLKETNADLTTELARKEKVEEMKQLMSDFKTYEDELLDKQIELEKKIKELNNIVLKMGQPIQTIHMLSPKPNSFYHTEQKISLGYQNPFYLKQAQKKQQSLYDGKVLLAKHDPIVVHDSEETLQLAQESRQKMKQMNKEIKPANYTKINHLSVVFVPQTALSREELYFSNISKTTNVSKSISIPNEDLSDDTTPSVAQFHKIVREEIFPIVNQVDARVQTFEIQFLKEAAKLVGDFKSLAKEADASLAKHKILELEIERLLKAVVSQDILSIVQNASVVDTSDLQTELERTKERFEIVSFKRKLNMLKFGMISTKSVFNYARENAHLKTTYKNLFDSISVSRVQTETKIASLQNELQRNIYKNAKLKTQLFKKVSDQKDNNQDTSKNTNFAKQPIAEILPKIGETNALSKPVTSNSVSTPQESKGVNNDKVIAPGMFKISPDKVSKEAKKVPNTVSASSRTKPIIVSQPSVITKKGMNSNSNVTSNSVSTPQVSKGVNNAKVIAPGMFRISPDKVSKEAKKVPNTVSASFRTKPITISQPSVITKKGMNSNLNGLSFIGLDNTNIRRPHPRRNTKNDRVPSASKSSRSKNKDVKVEEHHRNLLLSKKNKHSSSACNNSKIDSQDVISKVVCAMCKKCLISVNHDECLVNYVNGKKSRGRKHKPNISKNEMQKKYQPKASKPKNVGSHKSIATPKAKKPRFLFRWSPTGRLFDQDGKLVAFSKSKSQVDCSNGNNACTSNGMEPKVKWFPNSTTLLGRIGSQLVLSRPVLDSDLEVAFRRNACFVRNLEGVDLLKRDCSTNLYTINLHEMASASPICLMARASSTKSWLWHQPLSHLNFDTINDLARNDFVAGLSKFKYHKEHICPSCEQGKSKRASHPPKPVPNSRQRLHLLHMDLCGPMRIVSINGKWYILVIVDDYSRYTWVHFLRSKDEAPENSRTKCLKSTLTLLASLTKCLLSKHRNKMESWNDEIRQCFTQNRSIIHRRFNKTPYELINGRKLDISFLHVFGALCYPKNDREDIGKLGAKGDIGFFIGYFADSCAYRIYNRRTKKIMEIMNVLFDELSAMAFEQRSLKPRLQSTVENVPPAQEPQVRQTSTASTTIANNVPIPTNSSSHVTNIPFTSQDVDELNPNAMVDGNTFVNPFENSSTSAVVASSSSQNVDPSNMHTFYQPYPHEFQWTKDHPLEQVSNDPAPSKESYSRKRMADGSKRVGIPFSFSQPVSYKTDVDPIGAKMSGL